MKRTGPWGQEEIDRFLIDTRIPVRIACNGGGGGGYPMLASLWFTAIDGVLWCATKRTARVAALLRRDSRCGFEVSVEALPYFGVRGTGDAALHDDRGEEILRVLLERYLGGTTSRLAQSLLARVDEETAIAITPRRLVSWDFRERMGDIG